MHGLLTSGKSDVYQVVLTFGVHFPFVRGDKTLTQHSTAYLLVGRIILDRKMFVC